MTNGQLNDFFMGSSSQQHRKSYGTCASADAPGSIWARLLGALAIGAAALAASGCGTLPSNLGKIDTQALAPDPQSPLVKIARASTPEGDDSGVRLLPLGVYSLDARIQLAERATRSLDIQYYHLEADATGRLLLKALRDAAARGVRVRLLLDDLYTGHADALLRGLASFENVEVRLFNPFCCARESGPAGRVAASLFDFGRLNHRMHNKLFIADGVMVVAGGRNIADEYFLRGTEANFVDMDAFVIGAVVKDFAEIFDRYWNSEVVYPIEAIGKSRGDEAARRADFDATLERLPKAPPIEPPDTDVLGYGPLIEEFDSGRIGLIWGKAHAFADPPEKLLSKSAKVAFETSVANGVMMRVWQAKNELIITSPYMIPGDDGMLSFLALQKQKVKVTIVTNSLAATDEPLVHNGYARYRPKLLDAGVDLYELSPTRAQLAKRLGILGKSVGRLHAKTAVIDQKLVFVGSMNLDPRSASSNTELGMFIESPALAKELLRVINISRLESAYRVQFAPKSRALQWLANDGDKEIILGVEPESSFWLRLHNAILGFFVPEQLL